MFFKINNFDKLDEETQQDIQDFVTGYTTDWVVEYQSECDVCGLEAELMAHEIGGGIMRICKDCQKRITNDIDKSLGDFVN